MAVVGAAALPAARFEAAGRAAVTLSAVAVPADPEHRVTSLSVANFDVHLQSQVLN
jgi:hypothetical protein